MTDAPKPQPLDFDTERGAARSRWIAALITIAIFGWMFSGTILPSETQDEVEEETEQKQRLVSVAIASSKSETVTRFFVAEGQAQPDRVTSIRAEATGQIKDVLVKKGDTIGQSDVIARFDTTQASADLRRAEQELARATREFENAGTLVDRGVATNDRLVQARAALASAEAGVTSANEMFNNSEITAPFAGRLEALSLNAGEFVSAGSEVGRIVDNTPLSVSIRVPQQSLRDIKAGQEAKVHFITGETRDGIVEFVGSSADDATRTFLAEISVDNADGSVPAGVSAEVRIPVGETTAHFLSPAILSLGTDGSLGVKTVGANDTVVFNPINIQRAETDGIWVSGLPDTVNVITIGQGYVNNGEIVRPMTEVELAEES